MPRLKKIWADGAYGGESLAGWCRKEGGWILGIFARNPDAEGFGVIPKRRIVKRAFSRIGHDRRMSKDYERKVQSGETPIEVAIVRLTLKRPARPA
jgi:putative transposase